MNILTSSLNFSRVWSVETVRKEGTTRILAHLSSLGGSPFLNRSSTWNSLQFNLSKLFDVEPIDATSLFFDHKLRCEDQSDPPKEVLCLKFDFSWVNTASSGLDMVELLLDLNESYLIDETRKNNLLIHIDKAVKRVRIFNDLKVCKIYRLCWYYSVILALIVPGNIKNRFLAKEFWVDDGKTINKFDDSYWTQLDTNHQRTIAEKLKTVRKWFHSCRKTWILISDFTKDFKDRSWVKNYEWIYW